MCSEKYIYAGPGGQEKEITCKEITTVMCIAGVVLLIFIPLMRMLINSIYRYVTSCQQIEELKDEADY